MKNVFKNITPSDGCSHMTGARSQRGRDWQGGGREKAKQANQANKYLMKILVNKYQKQAYSSQK
jgi:hypothetical protein